MRCEDVRSDLQAYGDGELARFRRFAILHHLHGCTHCAALEREARELRQRIRASAPRFAAPATLRSKVASLVDNAPKRPASERWQWLGGGALAGACVAALLWWGASTLMEERESRDFVRLAVAAHAAAANGDRLVEVTSSDQHTVKPWLSARLDYSPPVRDFAAIGFPLVGARIERIDGRPVATLVYRYRLHTVDVFVRPGWIRALTAQSVRGFNAIPFSAHEMDWLVVSDASPEGLAPLVRGLRE